MGVNLGPNPHSPQVIGHRLRQPIQLRQVRCDIRINLRVKAIGVAGLGQELLGPLWIVGIRLQGGIGSTRHTIRTNRIHRSWHPLTGKHELHDRVFVDGQI
jgi:hypothetical protein